MWAVVDGQLNVVQVSAVLEGLLGRRGSELAGQSLVAFTTHPEEARDGLHATAEGKSPSVRLVFERPDGERVGVQGRALSLSNEQCVVLFERTGRARELLAMQGVDLFDQIRDGFVAFDRHWRFIFANRAAEEYMGATRDKLLGHTVFDVYPSLVGSDIEKAFLQAAAGKQPVDLELPSPVGNRWLAYRILPTPTGLAVYFSDHSEQHRVKQALRESEARYRALFESSMDGTLLTAEDGSILAANPTACTMLRRSEDEIRRLGFAALTDERHPPASGPVPHQLTMTRGDGSHFPAEISSSSFQDADGRTLTSLSFRDRTDQVRAAAALELIAEASRTLASSLDYDATLDNLTRLVVPQLAQLCLVDVLEEGAVRRVGLAADEQASFDAEALAVLKRSLPLKPRTAGISKVMRSSQPELVVEVDDDWLRAAAQDQAHLDAMRRLGARSVLLVPLVVSKRTLGVLTLVLIDEDRRFDTRERDLVQAIADRAALAIDHAQQHAAAVRARRLRDDVLQVVAHDLRAPLNAIVLTTDLLRRHSDHPRLETIRNAARKADRLIQDLLVATALEDGQLPLMPSEESVESLLAEVVALHRPVAEDKRIQLDTQVTPPIHPVRVDRHRVVQMLSNLVGNALKFTPAEKRILLKAEERQRRVLLHVEDEGPGMDHEQMAHLFDRFWAATHAKNTGFGLGLVIVKGIVEAHGGDITVQSRPGKGTRITVELPAAEEVTSDQSVEAS